MANVTINAKMIGIKKPVEVFNSIYLHDLASKIKISIDETTLNNLKHNLALQKLLESKENEQDDKKELSEIEKTEQKIKATEKSIKDEQEDQEFIKDSFNFMKEVLSLSPTQVNKAKKMVDSDGVGIFVSYLIMRLNGTPDFDPEEVLKKGNEEDNEEDSDPKKD